MNRLVGIMLIIIILFLLLNRTAIMPERFTGIWYRSENGYAYHFENGIIEQLHPYPTPNIDGAYCFTRDTITLFVSDPDGVDLVEKMYWIHQKEGDMLSEDPAGKGSICFSRKNVQP